MILAAGSSQRLGRPKQLLRLRGVPLVRHIANVVLDVACEARAIVVGCHAPEVLDALQGVALEPIMNVDHREGV
ncbi:MAG TPA: NTP transferase domain-containing protein, partial [Polyangiales bacterium]|nr:NTP transferase domain-containing protein [Polyangiales bacterium]